MNRLSRRTLLTASAASAGLVLARTFRRLTPLAQTVSSPLHLPLIVAQRTPSATPIPEPSPGPSPTAAPHPPSGPVSNHGHVVHLHAREATHWDYGSNYYGDYVDQEVVTAMMDAGVMALTGLGTVAEAWRTIVPGYAPGRAIAIKINMNNCYHCELPRLGCEDWQLALNAVIHPVNALVDGLRRAYPEFDARDVWVYEGTVGASPPVSQRRIPSRFVAGCRFPGVRFFDTGCAEPATYDSTAASAIVRWQPPAGIPAPPSTQVTDLLVHATYVINIPIMRRHGAAGVTLGFKNHFGSVADCSGLHEWLYREVGGAAYSALADLYTNPNIAAKTVLTIGDGLFGNWESNTTKAKPWRTFGGQAANSLLLSTDPVAIDCVMTDLLHAEEPVGPTADAYLQLATQANLGVYERGDPWGGGYRQIHYERKEW